MAGSPATSAARDARRVTARASDGSAAAARHFKGARLGRADSVQGTATLVRLMLLEELKLLAEYSEQDRAAGRLSTEEAIGTDSDRAGRPSRKPGQTSNCKIFSLQSSSSLS